MKGKLLAGYIAFLVLLTSLLSFLPGHNGDMDYYIACTIEKEQGPGNLFFKTDEVLQKELPPAEYASHHERLMTADQKILDFYRIKPVYILLVTFLHRLGFTYIYATLIPSWVSYFFIGLFTGWWALHVLKPALAILVSALIMVLYPSLTIARLSTPDALSALIILAALYSIYFEKGKWTPVLLLFFSILVRMDNLVAAVVLFSGLRFWPVTSIKNRLDTRSYIVLLFVIAGIALSMNFFLVSDFWWFTQISYAGNAPQYGRLVLLYFSTVTGSVLLWLALLYAIAWFSAGSPLPEKSRYFIKMIWIVFLARFLAFPYFEERFVSAYYICAILILAEMISRNPRLIHSIK